jgi:hypothetical protein
MGFGIKRMKERKTERKKIETLNVKEKTQLG